MPGKIRKDGGVLEAFANAYEGLGSYTAGMVNYNMDGDTRLTAMAPILQILHGLWASATISQM